MESTTDLAAILLDEPVKGVSPEFRLPDSEVQIKEQLTAVGYGLTKLEGGEIERRYQGQNVVTGIYVSNLQDSGDGAEGLATARTRREAAGLSASSAVARRTARTRCSRASTHTSIG